MAGGYLVLDPAYSGVVVSTSSRFYTVVQPADASGSRSAESESGPIQISVRSPQFVNAVWVYELKIDGDAVRVEQRDAS